MPVTPITDRTLPTFRAAIVLAALSKAIDPELEHVQWVSWVSENRRYHLSPSAMESGHPRGNRHVYNFRVGYDLESGQAWYSRADLKAFIAHLKANPDLVTLLKKNIRYRKVS